MPSKDMKSVKPTSGDLQHKVQTDDKPKSYKPKSIFEDYNVKQKKLREKKKSQAKTDKTMSASLKKYYSRLGEPEEVIEV